MSLVKFSATALLAYVAYKACQSHSSSLNPIVHGASSSMPRHAKDAAEEASMDSFPASDAPARNIFT